MKLYVSRSSNGAWVQGREPKEAAQWRGVLQAGVPSSAFTSTPARKNIFILATSARAAAKKSSALKTFWTCHGVGPGSPPSSSPTTTAHAAVWGGSGQHLGGITHSEWGPTLAVDRGRVDPCREQGAYHIGLAASRSAVQRRLGLR